MKSLNIARKTFIAVALSTLMPAAFASGLDDIDIELKVGSLGGGGEINYAFNPKFTAGVGINRYTTSIAVPASDIDYEADFKLQTIPVLGSWHPFEGTFRFTGGAMINSNSFKMTAKPKATFDIGGVNYTGAQVGTLTSKVEFNSIAPYFGLGWGKSAGKGFGMTLDIGVLFQGTPKVDLTASGAIASNSQFQSDLAKEKASAESDMKSFNMWPVFSTGINYRF